MMFLFYETYDKILVPALKAKRKIEGRIEPDRRPHERGSHAEIFHNGVSIIS